MSWTRTSLLLSENGCLYGGFIFAAAEYIRRLLRHQLFRTRSQRVGKVVRVRHSGVRYWQVREKRERALRWCLAEEPAGSATVAFRSNPRRWRPHKRRS